MHTKTHKIISAGFNAAMVLITLEGLIAILNLNQPYLYFRTAFYVGFFFIFQIPWMYDLHFKPAGSLSKARLEHRNEARGLNRGRKVLASAIKYRSSHFFTWKFLAQFLNYCILPGMIFWGSISVFFLNFGFPKMQQIFAVLSGIALFVTYLYLKEIFWRGREVVDKDIFVGMTVTKIYTAALVYAAVLGLVKNFCLDERYLVLGVFSFTFLLIYQALFQHRLINKKNIGITMLIALAMALISYPVLVFCSFNYFTAAVLLTVCYNLLWGVFHYHLDQALTWKAMVEILFISAIIAGLIFSATNFRAAVFDGCGYREAFPSIRGS